MKLSKWMISTQSLFVALVVGLALNLTVPVQATLMGRLEATTGLMDYQAYYDTDIDITWAANADINGQDTWANQLAWVAGLTIDGVSGWRLPTTTQPDASCSRQRVNLGFPDIGLGTGCTGSEMGHLFNLEGITATAPSPFSNVQGLYWSGTEFALDTDFALDFHFGNGRQGGSGKNDFVVFAWAVRTGDVPDNTTPNPIPEPSTMLLFGTGLLVMIVYVWRRERTQQV